MHSTRRRPWVVVLLLIGVLQSYRYEKKKIAIVWPGWQTGSTWRNGPTALLGIFDERVYS